MFYSPTILAKKSPLGTVWMAAHLERKIKKAQIEKINIAFYADKLIYPDVPIALRLSAHLMLGLVRIYAWKVDYTFTDSNRLLTDLRTAIVNIKIDLPCDANRAPPKSVTLPSSFDLDGIDLDDLGDDTEGFNAHQKTYEQITITDYGEENYVRFVIDENISSSPSSHHSMRGAEPIDDVLPPCSDHMQELITKDKSTEDVSAPANLDEVESQFHETFVDNQFDHAPDGIQNNPNVNQSDEFHDILRETQFNIPNENQSDAVPNENQFHDNIGENLHHDSPIEQLRSVHPSPPLFKDSGAGATGHYAASPNNDINAAQESPSPVPFQLNASPEEIAQVNQNVFQPSPQREDDVPSPQNAMQQDVVGIAIAPSPPPVREKRKRKKTQYYFDRHIVLSNKAIKEQLKDQAVNLLVRKRKKLPSGLLDVWRHQCAHLKDQVFDQPLISWKFAGLQEKRTYPAIINEEPEMQPFTVPTEQSPNHGITIEEPINSPVGGPIPQSPRDVMETIEEPPLKSPTHGVPIEEPFIDPSMGPPCHSPNNDTSFTINPPASPLQPFPIYANEPPERLRCQPVGDNIRVPSPLMDLGWNTPTSSNNIHNSPSSSLPAFEPEVLLNSRRSPPAKRPWPMSESSLTPSHERDNFRTPKLRRSAEIEDLNFLETPPSVKAKRARIEDGASSPTVLFGNDSEKKAGWSARSMGMVKYLREHLRGAPNAEDQNGNISLDHILEGKTRKYCARMFFETLVLKTEDYIDVKQEKPYGDVLIMPKTKLTAHN